LSRMLTRESTFPVWEERSEGKGKKGITRGIREGV